VRVGVGWADLLVVEVLASDQGCGVIADREPGLGDRGEREVVGAPEPPILVATQPGSTELDRTPGQRRATPNASRMSKSLLSE
jgi:hypothetical protein